MAGVLSAERDHSTHRPKRAALPALVSLVAAEHDKTVSANAAYHLNTTPLAALLPGILRTRKNAGPGESRYEAGSSHEIYDRT
jgi:hypothetical protein